MLILESLCRLLNHLIRAQQQRPRHREAECLGSLEVDHESHRSGGGAPTRTGVLVSLLWLQPTRESWVTTIDATARLGGSDIRVGYLNQQPLERQRPRLCLCLLGHPP